MRQGFSVQVRTASQPWHAQRPPLTTVTCGPCGAHRCSSVGPNIATDDQPYRALPSLLLARDKNGNFINPADGGCTGSPDAIERWKGWLAKGYTSNTEAQAAK